LISVYRALLDHTVPLRACLSLQSFAMQVSIALADQTRHDRKTMFMVTSVREGRTVPRVQWRPSSAQQACTQLKNSRRTALYAQLDSTAQMAERQSAVLPALTVLKARGLMCLLVRLERSVRLRSSLMLMNAGHVRQESTADSCVLQHLRDLAWPATTARAA
jgi:hypothetical protein